MEIVLVLLAGVVTWHVVRTVPNGKSVPWYLPIDGQGPAVDTVANVVEAREAAIAEVGSSGAAPRSQVAMEDDRGVLVHRDELVVGDLVEQPRPRDRSHRALGW